MASSAGSGIRYCHRLKRNLDGSFWCRHCKQNLAINRSTYYKQGHPYARCLKTTEPDQFPPPDIRPQLYGQQGGADGAGAQSREHMFAFKIMSIARVQARSNPLNNSDAAPQDSDTDSEEGISDPAAPDNRMLEALRSFFLQTTGTFQVPDDEAIQFEITAPARSTLWYQERCSQPLYPGCKVSLIQAIYVLLSIRQEKLLSDVCFGMLLRFASCLLPK